MLGDLQKNWLWLMVLGCVLVVLGIIGLGSAVFYTVAGILYLGVLIFLSGILQLIHSFQAKGWKSLILSMLIGVLYLVAGYLVIVNPLEVSVMITLILAIIFICVGIARIVMAMQHMAYKGWGMILFNGIITVLLGIIIAGGWPISGLWVIGTFIAVELLLNGISCIALSLAVKKI